VSLRDSKASLICRTAAN